jgi:predicted nuclease of predicted toxin-antitoxin system
MKIYFDENISKYLADAFNSFELTESNPIEVISTVRAFNSGAPDEDLVSLICDQGGILLTKDSDFKKIKLLTELMKQHKLGVFFFHAPKAFNKWIEISILIKVWPEIRSQVLNKHRPPFLFEFGANGKLKELKL